MFFNRKNETRADTDTWETLFNQGSEPDVSDSLSETTIFRCVDYISKSVAKLPIKIVQVTEQGEIPYKHKYSDILKYRHNDVMSSFDSMSAMIASGELYGTSGLFIGANKQLYPCKVNQVTVDNIGLIKSNKTNKILYSISIGDEQFDCFDSQIILYRSGLTLNGIESKATTSYIKQNLQTAKNAQNYLSDTFSSGGISKLVVQMTSDIKEESEIAKIQQKFQRLYSAKGRILTIPAGFNVSNLNMSLADSLYPEIRRLSQREIATAFGVPMSVLNDIESANNNSLEQTNLDFLLNTLDPKLTQLEQELNWKLLTKSERDKGVMIKFDTSSMFRLDADKESQIIQRYVQCGVYTIADGRRIKGLDFIDGTKEPILSSGSMKLSLLNEQNNAVLKDPQKVGENEVGK